MKALPLWQPWATLVAIGAKRVETRDFPPRRLGLRYGQRIAIHATKGGLNREQDAAIMALPPFARALAGVELPRGAIVAMATLDRASQMTSDSIARLEREQPDEHAFGLYAPGRWAWVLRDVRPVQPPAPARGSQGTFDWHPDGHPSHVQEALL